MAKRKTEKGLNLVTLRTSDNDQVCQIEFSPLMQRLVYRWSYKVQNRNRWKTQSVASDRVRDDAKSDLKQLGVTDNDIKVLAKAGVVEVSIPYENEKIGWEARALPWEYLISAATKSDRGDRPICVVRHLDVRHTKASDPKNQRASTKTQIKNSTSPKNFALIETAPGKFRGVKSFASELDLISGSLRPLDPISIPADSDKFKIRSFLKHTKKSPSPDVIHLTGIDAHRGHEILNAERETDVKCDSDGVYLASKRTGNDLLDSEQIGELLNAGEQKPMFVGLNCWYSGARIAPQCVAQGAQAALGYQNTFDDFVAEVFFTNFYQAWVEGDWDVLSAFLQAWEAVQPYKQKIKGSGLILWSRSSLVNNDRANKQIKSDYDGIRRAGELLEERQQKKLRESPDATPDNYDIRDLVGVKVKPVECLNYAMLHNRRSVVDELCFWLKTPQAKPQNGQPRPGSEWTKQSKDVTVQDLEIEVLLVVGADSFPYRTRLTLTPNTPCIDLADAKLEPSNGNPGGGVQVPLISELARSVDERMQTSLFVNVKWHDQTLYCHTHSVSLLPTDEWSMEDEEICWLPSFVLPRDPEVARIIDTAKKYLRAITDNPIQGFDGYQSGENAKVIMQAQAIWSAIIHDYPLGYIGPPPVYSKNSQRLRTPSQMFAHKYATCLDLTLLFVSCLEWIELYPVIMMTELHAFAGFWISVEARDEFLKVNETANVAGESESGSGFEDESISSHPERPWISGKDTYDEIRDLVNKNKLIPIECTSLTDSKGFQYATTYARVYFQLTEKDREQNENRCIKLEDLYNVETSKNKAISKKRGASKAAINESNALVNAARKRYETVRDELAEIQTNYEAHVAAFDSMDIELSYLEGLGEISPRTTAHYHYDNFHSMVDICTSREYVTPLPLCNNDSKPGN